MKRSHLMLFIGLALLLSAGRLSAQAGKGGGNNSSNSNNNNSNQPQTLAPSETGPEQVPVIFNGHYVPDDGTCRSMFVQYLWGVYDKDGKNWHRFWLEQPADPLVNGDLPTLNRYIHFHCDSTQRRGDRSGRTPLPIIVHGSLWKMSAPAAPNGANKELAAPAWSEVASEWRVYRRADVLPPNGDEQGRRVLRLGPGSKPESGLLADGYKNARSSDIPVALKDKPYEQPSRAHWPAKPPLYDDKTAKFIGVSCFYDWDGSPLEDISVMNGVNASYKISTQALVPDNVADTAALLGGLFQGFASLTPGEENYIAAIYTAPSQFPPPRPLQMTAPKTAVPGGTIDVRVSRSDGQAIKSDDIKWSIESCGLGLSQTSPEPSSLTLHVPDTPWIVGCQITVVANVTPGNLSAKAEIPVMPLLSISATAPNVRFGNTSAIRLRTAEVGSKRTVGFVLSRGDGAQFSSSDDINWTATTNPCNVANVLHPRPGEPGTGELEVSNENGEAAKYAGCVIEVSATFGGASAQTRVYLEPPPNDVPLQDAGRTVVPGGQVRFQFRHSLSPRLTALGVPEVRAYWDVKSCAPCGDTEPPDARIGIEDGVLAVDPSAKPGTVYMIRLRHDPEPEKPADAVAFITVGNVLPCLITSGNVDLGRLPSSISITMTVKDSSGQKNQDNGGGGKAEEPAPAAPDPAADSGSGGPNAPEMDRVDSEQRAGQGGDGGGNSGQQEQPQSQASDCSSTGTSGCSTNHTIIAHDREFWDVGLGLSAWSFKVPQYNSANPPVQVSPKNQAGSVYGFFNFYPFFALGNRMSYYPSVAMGIPVFGKVFYAPFFGISENVGGWWSRMPLPINVVAGMIFLNQPELEPAGSSYKVAYNRVWKRMIGIELPVSALVSKLKSLGSTGSSNSSGNNKNGSGNGSQ